LKLVNVDSERAMEYSIEALGLARELELFEETADCCRSKGIAHWAIGEYPDSLRSFREAMTIFEELEDPAGVASIYSCFGNISLTQGLPDVALDNYLKSQRISEELEDEEALKKVWLNIGNVYMRKNMFDSAISNYTKALAAWQKNGNEPSTAICYHNIGMIHRKKGEFSEALEIYRKALKIREETGDRRGTANTLMNMGSVYEDMEEFDRAVLSFRSSLEISEIIGDRFGTAASCCSLGHVLLALDSLEEAETFIQKGLTIARDIGAVSWEVKCLENQSYLFEKKGNPSEALRYARKFSSRREEQLNEESSENLNRLLALYETEKKEREAEVYRLKSADLEDEVEKRTDELTRMNEDLRKLISECQFAEDAREKAETDLHSFLENVDDVVYFQSLDGSISGMNSACLTVSGHKREEFEKDRYLWLKMMHPDDLKFRQEFLQVEHAGEMSDTEYRISSGENEWRWLNSRMVAIHDGSGKLIGYNCIDRDITMRKEAEQKLLDSIESLEKSFRSTIYVISKIAETRDPYTSGHQMRTADLAREMAQLMGFSEEKVQSVYLAGVVHDIGKIYIPQEFLTKPGSLNTMEMDLIRMHPAIGFDILSNIDLPWPIADIVLQHHELLDGSGYPSGLSSNDISMEARILCVADVVEAMSSHRPYRASLGTEKALEELAAQSGKLYDPDAVNACRALFHEKGYSFN
jgi:PAS domain S-box-containing protein/putative nucleotidyltransferase with HDIG domain